MKNNWKNYMGIGVAVFLTFAACSLFLITLLKIDVLIAGFGKIAGILESIIIGIVIAYVLNPVMVFFEKKLTGAFLDNTAVPEEKKHKWIRSVSIVIALIIGVSVVTAVVGMMLPQLFDSLYGLAMQMPEYLTNFSKWLLEMTKDYPVLEQYATEFVDEFSGKINDFFTYDFIVVITTYLKYFTSGVISAVNAMLNVVVGLIVAVYLLYSKENFSGQAKKILYAVFDPSKGNLILTTVRKTNQIFGGFIIGKIIDSAIIGVLCFICLSVMNMPYTLLVSVIVGVTNVIPFFGPFIGAIPSAILILLVSPMDALYFIIFVIILQQVDGNIIGPAILGESTGLSSFWVIFAIMLFGGLFGVVGMIIGVPTVGVCFYLIKLILDHRLTKKNYPLDTESYMDLKEIDEQEHKLVYYEPHEEKSSMEAMQKFKKKFSKFVKNVEKKKD